MDHERDEAPPAALPELRFSLLVHVRQMQAEHGLKHGDYTRYRQYCAKRAQKLYKTLKLLHGRGRYVKKEMAPESYVSERHLQVPLTNAERSWSSAMELKHNGNSLSAGSRHYMLLRLCKAEKWALELAKISILRCDPRTALEAEAYASMMAGTKLLEVGKDWHAALKKFRRSENVLQELVKDGTFEQQGICRQYLKELEPNIRFCQYQQEKTEPGDHQVVEASPPSSPNLKALKLRFSQAPEEGQVKEGHGESASFSWRGIVYPVNIEKVGQHLLAAEELLAASQDMMQTDDDLDPRTGLYDRVIQLLHESRSTVHNAFVAGDQIPELKEQAEGLTRALLGKKLEMQLVRGYLGVQDAQSRMQHQQAKILTRGNAPKSVAVQSAGKAKAKAKHLKGDDIVRMFDGIEGIVAELSDLANNLPASQSEQLIDECSMHINLITVGQLVYTAVACSQRKKHATALVAARRASDMVQDAKASTQDLHPVAQELFLELEKLANAQAALSVAEWHSDSTRLSASMTHLGLDAASSDQAGGQATLKDSLNHWKAYAGQGKADNHLAPMPPSPAVVPVRPFTLDAALGYVALPPLDKLYTKAKESKSTLSRLFGWS
mmetsp:Transcript_9507/g.27184  ORF Transcript_9507/g.27184 Transcript_9507/m.27184 type:complete len:608 (-) Transcript_9507:1147-2970(-)|eukprot:CAMPEP_0117664792 /NCGR_PEP_ID=MMETSP0804-20121206/9430_1 /TAXON_ID=1074897 /ORGANISM="Tetraselmis astigmatica, Strain CCMP880" /LENGTH=607 /DNA_ID=CAMNT_0005472091 /DNA_START=121 /DNA_END=1944 /DNA_ORIENTATION=-